MNIAGKISSVEFVKFCIVGGAAAASGFVLLYFLTDILGLHYLLSYAISFVLVNAASFAATALFAFRDATFTQWTRLGRYYLISATSLLGNSLMLYLAVDVIGLWYLAAAIVLAALNAPVNYLLHRRFTFRVQVPGR